MVATLLKLRFTVVRHQLQREWWRILMLVGGAVWSLSLLPLAVTARSQLADRDSQIALGALMGVAVVFALGWVIVPMLVSGVDDSLDPARFATFGVSARRLMPGLTVSAFLTLPAIFFAAVLAILAFVWTSGGAPAIAVALTGAALSLASLVMSARLATAWATRVLASRHAREVALATGGVIVVAIAALVRVIMRDGLEIVVEYDVPILFRELGRTPIGSPVAAAEAAARGSWGAVWWRLALAAAWVVFLFLAWRANVAYALVNPAYRGGGARRREDSVLAAAERKGGDGVVRASTTRNARYWSSDPRYVGNMISAFAFPVLFLALVLPISGIDRRFALMAPVLLAASIGWGRHNDIAYDSTAMWIDISAGRLGERLMRGRMRAVLRRAAPSIAVRTVLGLAIAQRWDLAPGVVGASVGLLGLSLAISALTSVLLPYRVPAPGQNPFGAEVGSVGAGLVSQIVSSMATGVLAPLVTWPLYMAVTSDWRWGWLGLAVGIGLGCGTYSYGIQWAGSLYDRRSGRLLGAVA